MADIMKRVWAIKQFTFNGVTYNNLNGGPLNWSFDDSSNEIGSRVADQVYVGMVLIPERDLEVTIECRDPYIAIAPGTTGSIVFTLTEDYGTNETLTFAKMTFLHIRAGGRKSQEAQSTLVFRYEAGATGSGTSRIARA